MAVDATKVVRGPVSVQMKAPAAAYADVGVVGDVVVRIENVTQEEVGEPYGPVPHNVFQESNRITVEVPIKQTTRELLEYVIGSRGGSGYGYFEDRPGRRTKYGLKLVPLESQGGGGTDGTGNFWEFYAVVCTALGDIGFSRSGERMFLATFTVCIDTGRSAGRRIGEYHLNDN